jgi:hypothetical protein
MQLEDIGDVRGPTRAYGYAREQNYVDKQNAWR